MIICIFIYFRDCYINIINKNIFCDKTKYLNELNELKIKNNLKINKDV